MVNGNSHKCVALSGQEASLIADYASNSGATISRKQVQITSANAVADALFS